MGLTFRNVDASPTGDVRTWPYEALVTALERGLVSDWKPIFSEIRRRSWGPVARNVEHYVSYTHPVGVGALFRAAINRARQTHECDDREFVARRVPDDIERSGLTSAAFATLIGTSPARLSTYANGKVTPSAAMLVRIDRMADDVSA